MAFSDLYKWSLPSAESTVTVYGDNSLLPHRYSSPSAAPSLLVYGEDSLLPYQYSSPSETVDLLVENGINLEFTNSIPEFMNTRVLSATVRAFNIDDNTDNTDPADQYYFSFAPHGAADNWVLSSTATWQTPSILDATVPAGEMERVYVLKAKLVRGVSEIGTISTQVTIDEVPPVTTTIEAAGTYPPEPLSVFLSIDDFTPVTTYYTTNGDNPTQSSDVYTAAGIAVTQLDTPINIKYFSVDSAGNIETPNWGVGENTTEIILDSIPPVVTIDSVNPTLLVVGTVADIVWHVDEYCNSARVEIGGGGVVGNGTLVHTVTDIPANILQTIQIPATVLPNGESTLYLFATDHVGNIGSSSFNLEFENQIPVINIYEVCRHTLASNDSATIIWKTSIAGDYSIRLGGHNLNEGVLLDSGSVEEGKIVESSILSSQLIPNVLNEVRIYVEAASGNIGFVSANMSVDTLAPTTTISIPGTEGPFLEPINIRIDAYDQTPENVTIDHSIIHGEMLAPQVSSMPLHGSYDNYATGIDTVETPSISPAGGVKTSFFYAAISCATPGATIYMTLNGDEPTTSSAVYQGSFLVDKTLTVKAFAVNAGMVDSEVVTVDYSMLVETVETPVITVINSGLSTVEVEITTATSGAEIHYTTNGAQATAFSPLYTTPLTFSGATEVEVRAIAIKSGMFDSSIASGTFLTPIGLSIPSIIDITTNSARVLWTTARVADSVVEYGEDPYLTTYSTIDDIALTTDHNILLPGLQDDTEYYYRVRSLDGDGIVTEESVILSFATNAIADVIAPTITNLNATIINSQEA